MKNNKEIDLLPDQPLGEKLIKKGFWLYFFTYLAAPAGYLTRVIISNSISVEEVGILYSIISFVSIISVYNGLGLTESLQYFLPKFWIKKQYNFVKTAIFMSLGVQIITSILIIVILWFVAPWLGEHYFHSVDSINILRYFCFYFLGLNIFQVLGSIFISFQDTFYNKLILFIRHRAMTCFAIIFFLVGLGSIGDYSLAWVISLFVPIVFGIIFFLKRYKQVLTNGRLIYNKGMVSTYRKYALWVFLGANATMLLGQIDQQMIIIILGPKSAGYYANYLSLFRLGSIIIGPIMGLLFPLVTELVTKKNNKSLGMLQNFMYTYFSIFALSLGALFIVLGPELALILFGKKFIYSGELLTVGGGFVILGIFIAINFAVLTGLGKVKEKVKIIAITGLLNIVMNLIFIQFWGLYGVVISTIIGSIIMVFLSMKILNKNEKIVVQGNMILKNLFVIFILSGVIYLIKGNLFILNDINRLSNLFILLVLGLLYYLLFMGFNWKKIIQLKTEIKRLRR